MLYSYKRRGCSIHLSCFSRTSKAEIKGIPKFRLFSPIVFYSLCFYIVILVSVSSHLMDRIVSLTKDDYNSNIYNSLEISSVVLYIVYPILMWLDTKRFVSYIDKWSEFKMLYLHVTKEQLRLGIRKLCSCLTVICCFSVFVPIMFYFGPPYFSWLTVLSYCAMSMLSAGTLTYWFLTFKTLTGAGNTLSKNITTYLARGIISAEVIGKYRILWLRLSFLASETGNATGKILVAYITSQLFCLSLCLYGLLTGITKNTTGQFFVPSMVISVLTSAITLYIICNEADHAAFAIKTEIQRQLHLIKTWKIQQSVQYEVNNFLGAILMNPPQISILGFVVINRNFFRTFISSLVTYLIVLLQFNVGVIEEKGLNTTCSSVT